MQPWQERVVQEKADLDDKISKLEIFLDAPMFPKLAAEEQTLLTSQAQLMRGYSTILGKRISRFEGAATA